jgi:hypothetical protein
MIVDTWVFYGHSRPFHYPSSAREAREIYLKYHTSSETPAPHTPTPPLLTPAIDWSLIQTLGNNTTTVDLNDEGDIQSNELKDNSTSDDSGSKLDGDGDDLTGDIGTTSELEAVPIEVMVSQFLLSAASLRRSIPQLPLNTEQHSAIVNQIQCCVNHNITKLLPCLHGLDNLIRETPLTSNSVIEELAQLLKSLTIGIQGIVDTTEMAILQVHDLESPAAPEGSTRSQLRKRGRPRLLLPPSPERQQKRKDSHAPL